MIMLVAMMSDSGNDNDKIVVLIVVRVDDNVNDSSNDE